MSLWKESLQKVSNKPDKLFSLLGLASKARQVVSGEVATENAVKSGKAWLVIVPTDASENTVKKFKNMCEFRDIPFYRYGTKDTLGHAMGKEERSSVAVTGRGFAEGILKQFEVIGSNENGGNC